jgi:hypothetical protein
MSALPVKTTIRYVVLSEVTFEPQGWTPFPIGVKSPPGCTGYLPVFDTAEQAEAFADGARVLEMRVTTAVLSEETEEEVV